MEWMRLCRPLCAAALALGLGAASMSGNAEDANTGMTAVVPGDTKLGDMKWQKAGKSVPYGMRVIALYGDPSKPGPYIYRFRVPTAYRLAPHTFPDDHVITILKGLWWHGVGERYDPFKMDEYGPGTFYVTSKNTPHFDFARTEVVMQVMGFGPVENPITYLNPDDDPRSRE